MKKCKIIRSLPFDLAGDTSQRIKNTNINPLVKQFSSATFNHEQFATGLSLLEQTHSMSGIDNCGVVITGVTGVGKSRLLNTYVKNTYSKPCYQPTELLTPLPIIKVRVPGHPTIPRLIEKILLSAAHVMPTGRSTDSLESRLHKLIINQGTEMMIFDEFQHLLPRNASRQITNATTNFIKTLADDYKLAFCFAGKPEMAHVLDGFDEIVDRLAFGQFEMNPFSMTSDLNTKDFKKYIASIQKKLQSLNVNCTNITTDIMLLRILVATGGKARHISMLFNKLLMCHQPGDTITIKRFVAVFTSTKKLNSNDLFNPFLASKDTLHKYLAKQKVMQEAAYAK